MDLLQQINQTVGDLNGILENWEFESLELMVEFDDEDQERAGRERHHEKSWAKDLGQTWAAPQQQLQNQAASGKPQSGDVVSYQNKLYRLGEPTGQGDFSSVNIKDGQAGMSFLPQFLMKRFAPQRGRDGKTFWSPRK